MFYDGVTIPVTRFVISQRLQCSVATAGIEFGDTDVVLIRLLLNVRVCFLLLRDLERAHFCGRSDQRMNFNDNIHS